MYYMNTDFTAQAVPSKLEYLNSIEIDGPCYDLQFNGSNLLVASHDGIRVYKVYNNGFKTTKNHQ